MIVNPNAVSVVGIVRREVAQQTAEGLSWNAAHPSGLTCPRAVWYHMHLPQSGDIHSWDKLAGLTYLGTILHEKILPELASQYIRAGYEVYMEKEVSGELAGFPVKGRVDLIIVHPVLQEKTVVDLKFLHPSAIYKPFHHHIVQVAVYAHLVGATSAILHYVARDLVEENVHYIPQDTLIAARNYAENLLQQANVENESELPPPYPPKDFPCLYKTARGTARCPFFSNCHSSLPSVEVENKPEITDLVYRYLEVLSELREYEEIIQPLEAEKTELEKMLKSYLKDGEVVETELGTVRLVTNEQKRMDTEAVRKLLQSLGLQVPTKTVITHSLQVTLSVS